MLPSQVQRFVLFAKLERMQDPIRLERMQKPCLVKLALPGATPAQGVGLAPKDRGIVAYAR